MAGYGRSGGGGYGGGNRGGSGGGRSYGGGSGGGRSGGGRGQSKEIDNTNTITIWGKDERDIASDKHPDLNGKLNIEGVEYWVNGWTQEGVRHGDKAPMYRLSIGDRCDDSGGGRRQERRSGYDNNRRDDRDFDRDSDRGRDSRDGRDDHRDGSRSNERYDQRREREEDEGRHQASDDSQRSDRGGRSRPFEFGRASERECGHDDQEMRNRPGPNDDDGGPAPEGRGKDDLDDEIPFDGGR